jgi:hypothetical protein
VPSPFIGARHLIETCVSGRGNNREDPPPLQLLADDQASSLC